MSSAQRLPIFAPDRATAVGSAMSAFTRFCAERTGRDFVDYRALHAFSCGELERFWRLFLEWSGLSWEGDAEPVCTDRRCEEAVFFPHLRLSYARALLALDSPEACIAPALTACHSDGRSERLTRAELRDRAARLAVALRRLGLRPGDRVVAVVANNAEAVIAALAVLALGATFSSASPEMGPAAIVSRFAQLAPSLLMVTLALQRVAVQLVEIAAALPSLEAIVALDAGAAPVGLAPTLLRLSNLLAQHRGEDFDWPSFPFNHPAFILFSSGTTGRPKCLMHGAGGTGSGWGLVQDGPPSVQTHPMGRSARPPAGADASAELVHQSHEIVPLDVRACRASVEPLCDARPARGSPRHRVRQEQFSAVLASGKIGGIAYTQTRPIKIRKEALRGSFR